jgi:hypothetical protein
MGLIASSDTLYAVAYLTELGRQYLFDAQQNPRRINLPNGQTIDRLKITNFSLGDPDINYDLALHLVSGDVPDLSGENETSVKGTKGRTLNNLISPEDSDLPNDDIDTVEYKGSQTDVKWDMAQRVEVLKPVVTQQLMTFVDGDLVSDGLYSVTPTNYGKNVLKNNELVIILKEPTLTQDGYRLRIMYPTTGSNYNKMTFQFEKASASKAIITQTVTNTVTNVSADSIVGRPINGNAETI